MYYLNLTSSDRKRGTLPYRKLGDRKGYVTREEAARRAAVVRAHYAANNPLSPPLVLTVVQESS